MNTSQQLTQVFNDNFVAYFRSHTAHINITGRNFRSDHKLLLQLLLLLQHNNLALCSVAWIMHAKCNA